MHEVARVSISLTFNDGTRRRVTIPAENLSMFLESELAELFNLTDCPADLSSVGMEHIR